MPQFHNLQAYTTLAVPFSSPTITLENDKILKPLQFTEHPSLCMPTNTIKVNQDADGLITMPALSCILNLTFFNSNRDPKQFPIVFRPKLHVTVRLTHCASKKCEDLISIIINLSDLNQACRASPTHLFDSAICYTNYRNSDVCDVSFFNIAAISTARTRITMSEYGDYVLKVFIRDEEDPEDKDIIHNIIPITISPGTLSGRHIGDPPKLTPLKFGKDGVIDTIW